MDETEFWAIVDETRSAAGGEPEEQADLLVERLTGLDPDTVVDFARHFETRFARAFRWDVWGAAEVMLAGGADEETFDYFRCWLIGRGRQVFEGAVHAPDDLAELLGEFDPEQDGEAEDLGYAADEAYEQLTGAHLPDLDVEHPDTPEGEPLDLDDEGAVAERLPKLWARFG